MSGDLRSYSLFQSVMYHVEQAAELIKLPPDYQSILKEPKNEIIVNFPVRLNSDELKVFTG